MAQIPDLNPTSVLSDTDEFMLRKGGEDFRLNGSELVSSRQPTTLEIYNGVAEDKIITPKTLNERIAMGVKGENLLQNSHFYQPSPDPSVSPPPPGGDDYTAGQQVFLGWFVSAGGITGLSRDPATGLIDSTLGSIYSDVPKSGPLGEYTGALVASWGNNEGQPTEDGAVISFAGMGDYYRVTLTPNGCFSAKMEQGVVASKHEALNLFDIYGYPDPNSNNDVRSFGVNGFGNNAQELRDALDFGSIYARGITIDLGGETVIVPPNRTFDTDFSVTFKNGSLDAKSDSMDNLHLGDLSLDKCSLIVGTGLSQIGSTRKITTKGIIALNSLVAFQYINGGDLGYVITKGTEVSSGVNEIDVLMSITMLHHCTWKGVFASGYYQMVFETAGNGSVAGYNTLNTTIESLTSVRVPSSSTAAGLHGFYLKGNYSLKVGKIFSRGYFATVGTSNALKVRDCWGCEFGDIVCDSLQLASDANSGAPLNSLEDNKFAKIDLRYDTENLALMGTMSVTFSASGVVKNNEIDWFRGELVSSGNLPDVDTFGGIVFTGHVEIENTTLQADEMVFIGAHVDKIPSGQWTRVVRAWNTFFHSDIETINTNIELYNCQVDGDIYNNSTTGTTSTILKHVDITGSLSVNASGGRIQDVDWQHVSSGGVNPAGVLFPNGTVRMQFVSFSDRVYLSSSTDFTNVP